MKKKLLFGGLCMVAVAAFVFVAKADPPAGQCTYVGSWYTDPCEPYYCPNPAAWPFQDNRCYAHWGMTDIPRPEGCE